MRVLPRLTIAALLPAVGLLAGCGSSETITGPDAEGWRTASPASQGMSGSLLDEAGDFADGFPTMRSLLVVRNGYLVYERYYRGYGRDDRPVLRSVTKSIASLVYGIAFDRGDLPGLDQPVADVFPQFFPPGDSTRRLLTVRHLLTMTSGLSSADADPDTLAVNWVQAFIQAPLLTPPGSAFRYDGAIPHILSGILTESVQQTLAAYADQHLFGPLGISGVTWDAAPEGYTSGYSGIALRPRDLARLGQLFVDGGIWEGNQIVSSGWLEASGRNQAPGGSASAGYGYLWWISGETGYPGFFGAGYGGQYLYVLPAQRVVVVITGDPDVSPDVPIYHRNLVPQFIAPAIRQP